MYFKLQLIVSVLLVLTYPGNGDDVPFRGSASVQGLFDTGDRLTVMLPLTMMFVFSAANVFVVAPKTIRTMWKRLHMGTLRRYFSLRGTGYEGLC